MTSEPPTTLTEGAKLTKAMRFVLNWLSEADSSAYGECRGTDLRTLENMGLVYVEGPTLEQARTGYERVTVTDAGRTALAQEGDE